jgi:hypothetical protein
MGTGNEGMDERIRQNKERGQRIADAWSVMNFDFKSLSSKTESELAGWPFESGKENPARTRLAEFEWQRRAIAEQSKLMKFSVWATAIAALLGALVGAVATYALPKMFDEGKRGSDKQAHQYSDDGTSAENPKTDPVGDTKQRSP